MRTAAALSQILFPDLTGHRCKTGQSAVDKDGRIPDGGRPWQRSRAQGCLLSQICGDALGSGVECYGDAGEIGQRFPGGVRDMSDGGAFDTLAGQPSDVSEMAIVLARTLVRRGGYDREELRAAYREWFNSGPFKCDDTVAAAMCGNAGSASQGNGALMRASPLGLFGVGWDTKTVAAWARSDASITHPSPVCQDANALFVLAIATAIGESASPAALYRSVRQWAAEMDADSELIEAIAAAETDTWIERSGGKRDWVLVALQNALWQLLHAPNLEEGIVDTIGRGGAVGANAAVCGALLGAVYGKAAIPARWLEAVQNCRPAAGADGVGQPRPEACWPVDAMELAQLLLAARPS